MRRIALLAAAILTLGCVGVAHAIHGQTSIKVNVSPSKAGSVKDPASVELKLETVTQLVPGEAPFAITKGVIFFDRNLVFDASRFKECAAVQSQAGACPASSKLGSGSAQGVAVGLTENLTVAAYKGPGSRAILLHLVGTAPLTINTMIEAPLARTTGRYGYKLTVPTPPALQQPVPGVIATLTNLKTSVKGVGLKSCPPSKKLSFKGVFSYSDGTTQTATTTVPCKPGRRR